MKTIKDLMEDFRMGNPIEDADLVRFYKHISTTLDNVVELGAEYKVFTRDLVVVRNRLRDMVIARKLKEN